jgi:hypothetical protein
MAARMVPCGNIAPATPLPQRSRQRPAPPAAVWPARSLGCGLPPKHHPAQVRGRRSPAGLRTTSQRCPHPCSSGHVPSRRGRGRTTWNSTGSSRDRCPPYQGLPHRHHPADAGPDGCDRADGQTPDGWTPDGLDTSRPDSRVRTREPDDRTVDGWTPVGWTPGPRTAGRVGWTPKSGHSLAMDSRHPGIPTTATRTLPLRMLSRSSARQTPPGRSATGATQQKGGRPMVEGRCSRRPICGRAATASRSGRRTR